MAPEDGGGWLTAVREGDNAIALSAAASSLPDERSVELTVTAGAADPVTVIVTQAAKAYAPGDFWPDAENPEGIVFYIDPESSNDGGLTGSHGKVISMRQSGTGLAWFAGMGSLPLAGAVSDTDGQANTDAIAAYIESNPDEAGFEAYEWVVSEYGEPWYLPAKEELRSFWAVMCGLTPEQKALYDENPVSGNWSLYVDTRDYRDAFDEKIVAAGGDKVDFVILWSSTKYDEDPTWTMPWYVDFGGGAGACTTQYEFNQSYVRAARTF